MAFDIYGETLRRGHCEVHPFVHEEYPCSVCLRDSTRRKQEKQMERDYYAAQAAEYDAWVDEQLFNDGAYFGA